jgi:hypothetical protein
MTRLFTLHLILIDRAGATLIKGNTMV